MTVLCAWCEQEGKPAVIRGRACTLGITPASHGICKRHETLLRKQMSSLAPRRRPRALQPRLLLLASRSSRTFSSMGATGPIWM